MTSIVLTIAVAIFLVIAPLLLARFLPTGRKGREVRITLQIIAPVVAVLPVFVGFLQYIDTQQAQAENALRSAYIQATEWLMEPQQSKQLAGIAAVAQLAAVNVERTWLLTDSLSTFARMNTVRSDSGSVLSRGVHHRAPYRDPLCSDDAPPDCRYNYAMYTEIKPLYQRNAAAQASIEALGTRNRSNEDIAKAPPRFQAEIQPPDGWLTRLLHLLLRSSRDKVLGYIEANWVHKSRKESPDQLIGEIQIGRGTEYPEIPVRPWLNLAHTDLSGVDAHSAWLEGGKFDGSDLSFSNLAHISLARSTFSDAWLVGADLYGADLRGADLQFADIRGSDLGQSDLRKAWASGANLSRANLWRAQLQGAYLIASTAREVETASGADMDEIVAYRADFTGANLSADALFALCMRKAFLREAVMNNVQLRAADLTDADLSDSKLQEAALQGADLRGAHLQGADLEKANLSHADLRGVDLSGSVGEPASVRDAITNEGTVLPPRWPESLRRSVSSKQMTPVPHGCGAERDATTRVMIMQWN